SSDLVHNACIVDEDIDVAQRIEGESHEVVHVEVLADVSLYEPHLAKLLKVLDGRRSFRGVYVGDDDPHTLMQETLGDSITDAPRSPSDDCCLPIQCHDDLTSTPSMSGNWTDSRARSSRRPAAADRRAADPPL